MANQTSTPIDPENEQSEPVVRPRGSRIMEDPVLAKGLDEDPLLDWLVKNYQYILLVIVALVAGNYVVDAFRASRENELRQAGDQYANVREEYEAFAALRREIRQLESKPDAKAEGSDTAKKISETSSKAKESRSKLNEYLTALGDARAPYDKIASLYQALVLIAEGDVAAARTVLSGLPRWEDEDSGSDERFYGELAAVALGRALIDDEKTYPEGRAILRSLTERGTVMNVSAATTLANISVTPEEKKEALESLRRLQDANPEQASLVKPAIDSLSPAS